MNLDDFLKVLVCNCRDRCWIIHRGVIVVRCDQCRVSFIKTPDGIRRVDMIEEESRS